MPFKGRTLGLTTAIAALTVGACGGSDQPSAKDTLNSVCRQGNAQIAQINDQRLPARDGYLAVAEVFRKGAARLKPFAEKPVVEYRQNLLHNANAYEQVAAGKMALGQVVGRFSQVHRHLLAKQVGAVDCMS